MPDFVVVGFLPKAAFGELENFGVPGVDEICSASTCLAEAPEDWDSHWIHNRMYLFDTPDLAHSVIPKGPHESFVTYGYRMLPSIYVDGQERNFDFPELSVSPIPANYEFLGFDVISIDPLFSQPSTDRRYQFGHSPLSCNYAAREVQVNRHCLIDDVSKARDLAKQFSGAHGVGAEPGDYVIVEVFRESITR